MERVVQITQDIAAKVLEVVDAGLVHGIGKPIPGQMCVEAAVRYALGLPHGDDPQCVSRPLRALKIRLNDSNWSSDQARAKGLRRLAVAQLGSAGVLDEKEFVRRIVDYAIRKSCPQALRAAASVCKDKKHTAALIAAASRCETEGTREAALDAKKTAAAYTAAAATYAAYATYATVDDATYAACATYATDAAAAAAAAAALDKSLAAYAEDVVQILIEMNAPGCQWLKLTETAS